MATAAMVAAMLISFKLLLFRVAVGSIRSPERSRSTASLVTEPPNVEPYQPTPPLELTDQTEQPAPIAEPFLSSSLSRRT